MPAKSPAKSSLALRLGVLVVVLVAAVWGSNFVLRPVAKTAPVYKAKAYNAVPGSVTVREEYPQNLSSEAEGRLISNSMDPGKKVKQGETLAQIDQEDLKLTIEHLESELRAAKEKLAIGSATLIERDNAKDHLDTSERRLLLKELAEADVIKERRLFKGIEQKLALEEINNRQSIESLENTLKVRRNDLKKMTVVAPFDGVITAVFARQGELLPAKAPIGTIITLTRAVEAKISEENFSGITVGQKATVRFLSYGGTNYDGSVIKILPTADPLTQRYIVLLDVKIEPEKLVPGLTGEVSIIVAEREGAMLIPRRALFDKRVYVVAKGRVELRKVEVGFEGLDEAEILSGLSIGDEVIVEELEKFRDGDRVKVQAKK